MGLRATVKMPMIAKPPKDTDYVIYLWRLGQTDQAFFVGLNFKKNTRYWQTRRKVGTQSYGSKGCNKQPMIAKPPKVLHSTELFSAQILSLTSNGKTRWFFEK